MHARLNISTTAVDSLVDVVTNGFFDRTTPGFVPFQQDDWHGWCVNGSTLTHFEHDSPVYSIQQRTDKQMFLPEVSRIVEAIPSEICAIRLLRLAPGGFIDFHVDDYEKFGTHDWRRMRKVHIPIVTNDSCRNFEKTPDGVFSSHWMQPGEYWYLDGSRLHGACNYGNSDRWHLVIELVACDELDRLITASPSTDTCKNLTKLLLQLSRTWQ